VTLWCEGRTEHAVADDYVVLPAGAAHSLCVDDD
jgi:quercetin dioxygenase-like cupin family protein